MKSTSILVLAAAFFAYPALACSVRMTVRTCIDHCAIDESTRPLFDQSVSVSECAAEVARQEKSLRRRTQDVQVMMEYDWDHVADTGVRSETGKCDFHIDGRICSWDGAHSTRTCSGPEAYGWRLSNDVSVEECAFLIAAEKKSFIEKWGDSYEIKGIYMDFPWQNLAAGHVTLPDPSRRIQR